MRIVRKIAIEENNRKYQNLNIMMIKNGFVRFLFHLHVCMCTHMHLHAGWVMLPKKFYVFFIHSKINLKGSDFGNRIRT